MEIDDGLPFAQEAISGDDSGESFMYSSDDEFDLALDCSASSSSQALRPVAEVYTVPFHKMKHANGSASDVPDLLASIVRNQHDGSLVDELLWTLSENIVNQGMLYNCASYAVPFLAYIAANCESSGTRLEVLQFLIMLAIASESGNRPKVKRNISKASGSVLRAIKFNPREPTVLNVSLCFLIITAPPCDEYERRWLISLLEENVRTGHVKFRVVLNHALSLLLNRPIMDIIDFEQLETDLIESAEEWESQRDERDQLLAFCGRPYARPIPLPTDIMRNIKTFLYSPVVV